MRTWAAKLFNGITLLGLGGVLIAFFINGRIDQYLHPAISSVGTGGWDRLLHCWCYLSCYQEIDGLLRRRAMYSQQSA